MTPDLRDQLGDAHARLAVTVGRLTDAGVRQPSLLPGWTVGHVLAHLARNADSHVRMLRAAARGEVADQYPGGRDQRAADIAAGAGRPASELAADVTASAFRLEMACDATPADAWRGGEARMASGTWPLADLPFRRWREVEIHHVDLGAGYGAGDWPDAYVDEELGRTLAGIAARLPAGGGVDLRATDTGERWVVPEGSPAPAVVEADRRVLLAWLVGRNGGPAFPPLGPWEG
jgi:maleylpyruvate isomerase